MSGSFRIEPLGRQHQRDGFQCGHDALDRYLRQQARQEADKHVAAPFVLVQGDNPCVLGYYTLSASSISTADVAPEMASKLPRYPQLPVTLIGRLAVDNRLKGQGRGHFCSSMPCGAALRMPPASQRWRSWWMPRTRAPQRFTGTSASWPCKKIRAGCICP